MEGGAIPNTRGQSGQNESNHKLLACPFERNCTGFRKLSQVGEHLKRCHTLKHSCVSCGQRFGALSDKKLALAKKKHEAACNKGDLPSQRKLHTLMTPEQDEKYNAHKRWAWEDLHKLFHPGKTMPPMYLGPRSFYEGTDSGIEVTTKTTEIPQLEADTFTPPIEGTFENRDLWLGLELRPEEPQIPPEPTYDPRLFPPWVSSSRAATVLLDEDSSIYDAIFQERGQFMQGFAASGFEQHMG